MENNLITKAELEDEIREKGKEVSSYLDVATQLRKMRGKEKLRSTHEEELNQTIHRIVCQQVGLIEFYNKKFDDGLFDVVLAPDLSKLEILSILPRLFPGTHLNHPKVSFYRTRYLHARSNPGTPVHADGEVIAVEQEEINYQILPGKLTLLVPADKQPET